MTTQCTGRTNSALPAPQRMRRAIGSAASEARTMPGSSVRRRSARFDARCASHAPFGVSMRSSAATSTPQLRAKASAACVGAPCASKAAADRRAAPLDRPVRLLGHEAPDAHREPPRRGIALEPRRARDSPRRAHGRYPSANASASASSDSGRQFLGADLDEEIGKGAVKGSDLFLGAGIVSLP